MTDIYDRSQQKQRIHEYVTAALEQYMTDDTSPAGYNVIRYAQQGLIDVDPSVDPQVFVDWYPKDQSYVILRLAKQGKLICNVIRGEVA